MWNATNQEYVAACVETYHKDYPYYIAHTVSNSPDYVSVVLYFSREPIAASAAYSYVLPADSLKIDVITNSYSSYSGNTARMVCSVFNGTVNIPVYEFIYTNAEFLEQSLLQPDIRTTKGGAQNDNIQALGVCCCAVLLFIVFCSFFRR